MLRVLSSAYYTALRLQKAPHEDAASRPEYSMSITDTHLSPDNHLPVAVHVRREALWPYYLLFFFSGFPALLYQVVWQRALFTIYGVNIESVTLIVTVFMLGLGLGSLAGGRLSRVGGLRPLAAFGAIESGIGIFGACSLAIFDHMGRLTAGHSLMTTGLMAFALLLVPTLLMGSTLPLLVEHLVQRTRNVGQSVGALYSVNTLGSAVACFSAAYVLMRTLGEARTVRVACAFNLIVGATAWVMSRRLEPEHPKTVAEARDAKNSARFRMCVVLAGVVGFIALAYEIIWYRLYSFTTGGSAPSFALLLGFYLAGIAYGSLAVRDACLKKLAHDVPRTLWATALVVLLGSIAAFLTAPVLARAVVVHVPLSITFVLVFVSAALLGSTLPLLAHASIGPSAWAGSSTSYLYLSNIVGSTLGSFVVGFVILDHWSTPVTCALLLAIGACTFLVLAALARPSARLMAVGTGCALCLVLGLSYTSLYSHLYERLLSKTEYTSGFEFADLIENRSGVVAVKADGTVFGGGIYDGRFNLDPVHDVNGIFRAYAAAGLKPDANNVLMIGLSSGSWAQVVASNPGVRHLTIVEINPGYFQLIEKHEEVRSLLRNPKVEIVTDDGRRWLRAHPEGKFDLIVMNTTFHWRAHASNLLSVEFLTILRQHLKPGGVLFYNTTSSDRVLATGARVFPYAARLSNFLAVSDRPLTVDKARFEKLLADYRIDGRPVFDLSRQQDRDKLREIAGLLGQESDVHGVYESGPAMLERLKDVRMITDDNMGTEWD